MKTEKADGTAAAAPPASYDGAAGYAGYQGQAGYQGYNYPGYQYPAAGGWGGQWGGQQGYYPQQPYPQQ